MNIDFDTELEMEIHMSIDVHMQISFDIIPGIVEYSIRLESISIHHSILLFVGTKILRQI
jgi:hypothetical protein